MKKTVIFISAAILLLGATAFTIQTILNWKIDSANAQVKFSIKSDGKETKGMFTGVKGEIKFDGEDLAGSYFNCTIDVATINTGVDGRDHHLKSKDFFNVEKYPVATFKSEKVEKDNAGFKATGNLTIKDSTKQITIPFTFDNNNGKGVFKGKVTIDRNNYGVGRPDNEPDPIEITMEIPVEKQP
jgi:polyisoprenoid-binding protein YceI